MDKISQPFIDYDFSKWNSPNGYSCVELPNSSGVYINAHKGAST